MRGSVGLSDISNFAKYRVTGEGATAWLDQMLACALPRAGRMTLAPMLKDDGRVIGDFSVACLDAQSYLLIGSGLAEDYHMRWFLSHLPDDGSVTVTSEGLGLCGLTIAGPNARSILASLTRTDVSHDAFKFMAVKQMDIGMVPALVGRVSYTGDLGYEIWVKPEYQRRLFDDLMAAGAAHNIGLFGSRALNALRLEKNCGSWGREFRPIYYPNETGLERFCAFDKSEAEFIGKAEAAKIAAENGGNYRLRCFVVEATDADVIGDEPIFHNGEVAGWVTSGGYAHGSDVSVAMGYVRTELAEHEHEQGLLNCWQKCCLRAATQKQPLFDSNRQPDAQLSTQSTSASAANASAKRSASQLPPDIMTTMVLRELLSWLAIKPLSRAAASATAPPGSTVSLK